jgi:hypothetical protein
LVKVRLIDDSKIKGRITIINDSTIKIKNREFTLDQLMSIQKRPIGNTVFGLISCELQLSGLLLDIMFIPLFQGFIPMGTILVAPFTTAAVILCILPSKHKAEKGWTYEISLISNISSN